MRVLTIARWYPSHDGPGRGTFVADLVGATAATGADARVISFDRVLVRGKVDTRDATLAAARAIYQRIAAPETLFVVPGTRGAPGVPVARLPVVRRPGSGDAAALVEDYHAALRPFLIRLADGWRPDVIHAHTGLPDGVVGAAVGRELGIPVVVTEHASTIEAELAEPAALERYRTLLDPGVRLLAVSPPVAARLGALLGVPAESIGVVPNPVDEDAFGGPVTTERDPDELLWVGALGEHKGINVLLEAMARLRSGRPTLRLRLVGGERAAGDVARLQALAGQLGLDGAISFDGWLDRQAVAAAMARAAAFVHPSPSETFGVVAAEAILAGLPVASRRSGGVPWIVELSGGFGAVADGDDPASFARAIRTVLDGRLTSSAEAARARLVASVGTKAVTAAMLDVYREAVAASAPLPVRPGGGPAASAATPRTTPTAVPRVASSLPRVLVATEREQSIPRAAGLPEGLREQVILVVPPLPDPAPAPGSAAPLDGLRVVEAAPVRHERPPKGRGPIARLKRATWKPPLTADGELALAVRNAAGEGRGRGPHEVVALDAPAAVIVDAMDDRRVRLAAGSLRWLADRWDAEAAGRRRDGGASRRRPPASGSAG